MTENAVRLVAEALLVSDTGCTPEHAHQYLGAVCEHAGDCTKQVYTCQRCDQESYAEYARAAIAALLKLLEEPTVAMCDAGDTSHEYPFWIGSEQLTLTWRAMLAAWRKEMGV